MSKKARLEDRFLEMRIQGMTYEEIAQALDVSKQTLINWSKDDDFQEQVNIARAIRLQAIVNKYQLNREANLQRYGKLLDRLSQEIDKRDLSDLPTDKLLKMLHEVEKRALENVPLPMSFGDSPFDLKLGDAFEFDVLD
jgi:DNA-binding XRE family transcriptional regulator